MVPHSASLSHRILCKAGPANASTGRGTAADWGRELAALIGWSDLQHEEILPQTYDSEARTQDVTLIRPG